MDDHEWYSTVPCPSPSTPPPDSIRRSCGQRVDSRWTAEEVLWVSGRRCGEPCGSRSSPLTRPRTGRRVRPIPVSACRPGPDERGPSNRVRPSGTDRGRRPPTGFRGWKRGRWRGSRSSSARPVRRSVGRGKRDRPPELTLRRAVTVRRSRRVTAAERPLADLLPSVAPGGAPASAGSAPGRFAVRLRPPVRTSRCTGRPDRAPPWRRWPPPHG